MRLAVTLGKACEQPPCAVPPSEFYGVFRAPPPAPEVLAPADAAGGTGLGLALALLLGLLIGGVLAHRFSARIEQLRDRYRAASELRGALAALLATVRRLQGGEEPTALATQLRAESAQVGARMEMLAPLVSETRAGHLAFALREFDSRFEAVLKQPSESVALEALDQQLWAMMRRAFL